MTEQELMRLSQAAEDKYMNKLQLRATACDTNVLIARVARGTGKTEGIIIPRMIRVADDMPCELSFLIHKTYVSLLSNIIPNIRAAFEAQTSSGKPLLEYGVDYVIGTAKLPSHFLRPRYPIAYPAHSIVLRNGHNFQLVASDQPESVAGRNAVHAIIEEMKHQKGEKLKSRIFPALRGGYGAVRSSPYYQGITGVTDAARLDLGEDNWYDEFEHLSDNDVLSDIVTIALHVDKSSASLNHLNQQLSTEKNPLIIDAIRQEITKHQRIISCWRPRLREMRANSTCFLKASAFVNKDILGAKFFKTQHESLSSDEFLSSICNIVLVKTSNMFFGNFKKELHCFDDSYNYNTILRFNLNDNFKLSAFYLKYFTPDSSLILGYDPGHFSSLSVAQEHLSDNTFRVLKSFTVYHPYDQSDLARQFNEFFGDTYNKRYPIILYYDRAGNKRRQLLKQIDTDANMLRKELESYGFRVRLMNEKQRTIYYYEHYKLLMMLFSEKFASLMRIRIDENECADLISSIFCSPLKRTDNKIELDKTSEIKVPLHLQAKLTTQLATSLMYMLYGHFYMKLPAEYSSSADIPSI
ncbi:MAG: hypothetical protein RR277_00980 [Rikenellaceae bacterium]